MACAFCNRDRQFSDYVQVNKTLRIFSVFYGSNFMSINYGILIAFCKAATVIVA